MADDYFSEDAATFGDRVAAGREALGLSQNQLAARIGVRAVTLQNWESDRSEPRANKLQMLAGVLNVSIIWLLTGEGGHGVAPAAELDPDSQSVLADLRSVRMAQIQLSERLARLEKRLRAGQFQDRSV